MDAVRGRERVSEVVGAVIVLLISVLWGRTEGLVRLSENVTVPAVLVLGDSIVDTGNNNYNPATLARCNYRPYGKDFQGGIPTGRFGNGKSAISLTDQVELLRHYKEKLKSLVGEDRTDFILSNSIVFVVAGSNDISNTYFLTHARQVQYDVPAYADLMVTSASNLVKELYEAGVRRIGVLSAPPIGCVPSQRTLVGGIERGCAEIYNEAAKLFNSKLSEELASLNRDLPSSRIVYIDVYNPILDVIVNYQKYGFEVGDRGCCGTGEIEVAELCNHLQQTCADDSEYVFWDSFHPTEAAYRKLISPILSNMSTNFPDPNFSG
ncbi:GDSL esterase/lipase EXL3-like isoform X2 [Prosopis cineraria]|uniref:GDSL esterase/lipase EXL3-like isoform X2 n=1 Tax=Prosopis cineraria TaxID=364024 RepID=UPI0024106281|nr:GDSL esterase/lipase EXL3-like isoform X2 [Prosopis cineraria]